MRIRSAAAKANAVLDNSTKCGEKKKSRKTKKMEEYKKTHRGNEEM